MPSSSRDSRDTWAQPAIPWRTSQRSTANNTSNVCSSATTSSGGLYRNLPKGAPANFPQSKKDPSEPLGKRVWDHEEKQAEPVIARRNKLVERSREYLPCYVKPRRSVIETDEELEVRSDAINRRQVWVRPIGFPSLTLREALEKAELVPLPRLRKAYPILVLTRDDQRKRGLIISEDGNSVEYLDVDTGRVEEASAELVFKPDATLLSIPNAAIRCRLDTKDEELDSKLQNHKSNLSQWTRTRVHVMRWGCIPTVYLSIIEPNFDLKPVVERQRSEPERKIQKLYRTLPGIVIPPPFTILRNCSVLHVEEDNAFIVQNDAPFETDPSESAGNHPSSPSLREQEQLYLEGDIVRAQYNELEMRVMIREVTGSAVVVRSVDSGATYEVGDFRELKPLLKREPSRAMRVTLPREYLKLSREELPVLLKTGVFDVFFESSESTPRVRLFTQRGQEIHVCLAKKTDPVIRADDSEDERSSTRSCRG